MTMTMPTVISSSAMLNAIVRGAERAAGQLGAGYFVVIGGDYTTSVRIYRSEDRSSDNVLDRTQSVPKSDNSVWSMKLEKGLVMKSSESTQTLILNEIMVQFFFLTEAEAVSYLKSIEAAVVKNVLAGLVDDNDGDVE